MINNINNILNNPMGIAVNKKKLKKKVHHVNI